MANVQNWRIEDTNPVKTRPVQSAIVIEKGDLIFQDITDGHVYPASELAGGTIAQKQHLFACWFLGVALEQSRSGDTDPIMVGTTGVYEFSAGVAADPAPAVWNVGDNIRVCQNAAGTALLDQTVSRSTTALFADVIGKCAEYKATGTGTVRVRIKSTVMGDNVGEYGACDSSSSGT